MFHMTSFVSADKLAGVIRFKKFPTSLGNWTATDGTVWNINAIIGKIVCACKQSQLHPYYTSTSSCSNYGLVQQEWAPHAVEVDNG